MYFYNFQTLLYDFGHYSMPMGVSHNCTFLRDFGFPLNFLFLAVMLRAPSFFSCRLLLTTGLIELLSATVIDSKDLSEGRVSLPIDLWIPAEQCDEGIVSDLPADRLRRNEVFLALRERLCILKPS
jgi:hypothetical protein